MKISLKSSGLFPVLLTTLFLAGCTEEPDPEPAEEKPVAVNAPPQAPKAKVEDTFAEEKEEPSQGRPDFQNMSEEERKEAWQKRREEWETLSDEEREARIAEMRAEREQRIQEMDTNNDGALGKDEVDERMWGFISQADKNGDNKVTVEEREEARAERETDRVLRELSGEEPSGRGFGGPGGGGDRAE